MMNKYQIIAAFSEKAKELSEDNLLKVEDLIDSLIEGEKKNNGIDKQSLLNLLQGRGHMDVKSFAKQILDANLLVGSVSSYSGRSVVIDWIIYKLDCTTIQAEALIKLMFTLGFVEISYTDNVG